MTLICHQLDDKQPIKLTQTIVNINKATCWPPVDIQGNKRGHYTILKHSNNLRL